MAQITRGIEMHYNITVDADSDEEAEKIINEIINESGIEHEIGKRNDVVSCDMVREFWCEQHKEDEE